MVRASRPSISIVSIGMNVVEDTMITHCWMMNIVGLTQNGHLPIAWVGDIV